MLGYSIVMGFCAVWAFVEILGLGRAVSWGAVWLATVRVTLTALSATLALALPYAAAVCDLGAGATVTGAALGGMLCYYVATACAEGQL